MKEKKLVLSLFNGMNCIGLALSKNKEDFQIYASEIDKYANKVSSVIFPNTVNLGDVVWVRRAIYWKPSIINKCFRSNYLSKETKDKLRSLLYLRNIDFDLIVAGSPCQGFSFAGKQLNFNDSRSKLFFDFVKILNTCKTRNPKAKFILENVKMKGEYEAVITKFMGIPPVEINSALVSAQNRVRLYWTNIGIKRDNLFSVAEPGIPQPIDKKIFLKDILEEKVYLKYGMSEKMVNTFQKPSGKNGGFKFKPKNKQEKAACLLATYYKMSRTDTYIRCGRQVGRKLIDGKRADNSDVKANQQIELREDNKTGCLTTVQKDNLVVFEKEKENVVIRRLTPRECGRLQTVPEWAIDRMLSCGVSESQLYKMLGNGWTVDVIAYILQHLEA